MEHIEEAGIHSGDSACSLPPYSISEAVIEEIRRQTKLMALELNVKGLMNVQYALKDNDVYILEVNPRASRTSPFVSKATGRPLAKIAASIMGGRSLEEQGVLAEIKINHVAVKESVFPFVKFPGVDTLLGPEMKSTGEVMGIDDSFAKAFAKAQLGAGARLPSSGKVFISVKDADKKHLVPIATNLHTAGFQILATRGTASFLKEKGVPVQTVNKVLEGRPHIVDAIKNGDIAMVINTTHGAQAVADSFSIRRETLSHGVTYFTTVAGARAAVDAILAISREGLGVKALQDFLA
jgi:carbamoyl-phosphate synthase large subunit